MEDYRKKRREQTRSRRYRKGRITAVFLIVFIVGAGSGVGMNVLMGKPRVQKARPSTSDTSPKETTGTTGKKTKKTTSKAVPLVFDTPTAMSHVFALSEQIGPRPAGSVREADAANYIVGKLGEYGYTVEDQSFTTADGFGSRNIVGTRRGTRSGYDIVLGAHYDSSTQAKGAVDNASGVGVVLELARVLSATRLEPTIRFVFFGANRPGATNMDDRLQGSRRYVDMLGSMERKDILGMICVDSVGQGEQLALRTQESGLQRLKTKLETFGRENNIPTTVLKAVADSDNMPFENAGVPAVWIEWCDAGGKLVTDDRYNSVMPGKVEIAGNLVLNFLLDLRPDDLEELKY